ncbi:MAG TPA: glutathione peroxidase [Macromonas sp.]|nr:glutathione peroxidase [Macromonas sp.]
MKRRVLVPAVLLASLAVPQLSQAAEPAVCPALLQHTFPRLQDEKPQPLCQYAGKVLLVVNTASYCGFTPQYKGLEALYAQYREQGLVVLGFPSNDFFQERDDNGKIADFCENTFGVKFPMFAKSAVRGSDVSPFYRQLAQQSGVTPKWNFYKYLVGRDGKVVATYGSRTEPDDPKLLQALQAELAKPLPGR